MDKILEKAGRDFSIHITELAKYLREDGKGFRLYALSYLIKSVTPLLINEAV